MLVNVKTIKKLIIEAFKDELVSALKSYVCDSQTTSVMHKRIIASFVKMQKLPSLTLERIERKDPRWSVGDIVEFPLASFTTVKLSQGKHAGHIAWKSSDKAIVRILHATNGWNVDYDLINVLFDASDEKEVLISGRYNVKAIKDEPEPGTLIQYGYTIPVYELIEA